jgi:hypothetical protein
MIGTTKVKFGVGQYSQVSQKMEKEPNVPIRNYGHWPAIHEDVRPHENTYNCITFIASKVFSQAIK